MQNIKWFPKVLLKFVFINTTKPHDIKPDIVTQKTHYILHLVAHIYILLFNHVHLKKKFF